MLFSYRVSVIASLALAMTFTLTKVTFSQNSEADTPDVSARLLLEPSHRFVVSGLDLDELENPAEIFFVTVADSALATLPPLLGRYERDADKLVFQPRFPLRADVTYRLHFHSKDLLPRFAPSDLSFSLPSRTTPSSATVSEVYPTSNTLPENLLKFYIHFSEPMKRGAAYEHIQLLRGDQVIERPFLELGEELWNAEQTRFTLFIHPGRIKRGLKPREENGPSLASGGSYTLQISSDWQVASGGSLTRDFEKHFSVTAADHQQPNLENWKIETPPKDSRKPVGLTFNEPLDHAMLNRVLTVMHQSGRIIPGTIEISDQEQCWEFVPDDPWPVGTYRIDVAANLEDRCGNSIARPFEVKLQQQVAALPSTKVAHRIYRQMTAVNQWIDGQSLRCKALHCWLNRRHNLSAFCGANSRWTPVIMPKASGPSRTLMATP